MIVIGTLACQRCALRFKIKDSFPVLVPEEAELPPGCEGLGDTLLSSSSTATASTPAAASASAWGIATRGRRTAAAPCPGRFFTRGLCVRFCFRYSRKFELILNEFLRRRFLRSRIVASGLYVARLGRRARALLRIEICRL